MDKKLLIRKIIEIIIIIGGAALWIAFFYHSWQTNYAANHPDAVYCTCAKLIRFKNSALGKQFVEYTTIDALTGKVMDDGA